MYTPHPTLREGLIKRHGKKENKKNLGEQKTKIWKKNKNLRTWEGGGFCFSDHSKGDLFYYFILFFPTLHAIHIPPLLFFIFRDFVSAKNYQL